jgi:transcriptional regulator with XRE-family HTH domain
MGLSQEKFGELVDCHRNYVGLIERGQQNITIDMLGRFAAALECSIAELMTAAKL